MSLVHSNPFNKPNPYKIAKYNPFQHASIDTNTTKYTHLFYNDPLLTSRSTKYLWDFKQNKLSHHIDFNRKHQLKNGYLSDFQKSIKFNSISEHPLYPTKTIGYKNVKLQNPFYRKNLIINKNAVENQLQIDLSIYRHKLNSTYQQTPQRISFAIQKMMEESPSTHTQFSYSKDYKGQADRVVQENIITQVQIQSPNQLSYSKTPQISPRELSIIDDLMPPKTIQFRRKTFYLNTPKKS